MGYQEQLDINRLKRIQSVEKIIGWACQEMKWLTRKEEKAANRERDGLIRSLSKSKEVIFSFANTKIHIGQLSPGCLICGQGYWSCMFSNRKCPGTCFFCPVETKIKKDFPAYEATEFTLRNPRDYIKFLKKYGFKGASISGGEPFLVFNRSLSFAREIKKSFGDKMYVWLYTNGFLVTEEKLRKLKNSGLNEIRFNIAARKYDLQPVEMAARIIPTVTVEIPSIPEDFQILKKTLPILKKIGVRHLNLHILSAHPRNYRDYIKRGYTFMHYTEPTVFESEIAALNLLNYALGKKIGLPINYCTNTYKDRFQARGNRRWLNPLMKEEWEELTDIYYIRRLTIQCSGENMDNMVKILKKLKVKRNLWAVDNEKAEIHIHSSLMQFHELYKYKFIVSYFTFSLSGIIFPGEEAKQIQVYSENKVFSKKKLVYQEKLISPAVIKGFRRLYLEKENENYVLKDLYLKSNVTAGQWRKDAERILLCREFEKMTEGFDYIC